MIFGWHQEDLRKVLPSFVMSGIGLLGAIGWESDVKWRHNERDGVSNH